MTPKATRSLPCLDRREFLAQGSMVALGTLLISACGDGLSGSPTGPGSVRVTVSVSDYAALGAIGGIVRLNGTSTPIAVVRASTTAYRAFSLICPHAGTTISINGSAFRCPNHGATFAASGAWTGGQRTTSLFEFTVVADTGAGTLTITS
ncbi:MAG: Rieske 2Fe-2S domain-containing protein [Gemmatimonadaceae bacterium]|nr:Rieske 2Fe-2S domain-containing protein [Gemmatimonadaceae bacterium]